MNIVKISGSIGTQMFQYAFFLALKQRHPDTLIDVPRHWIGSLFPLPVRDIASPKQVKALTGSTWSRLAGKRRDRVLSETCNAFNPDILLLDDTYFTGSWYSFRYFESISGIISRAFTIGPHLLSEESQKIIGTLAHDDSVAIHIYRPESRASTCTADYYNWAIASIRSSIPNPRFTIVTDDVDWVSRHLVLNPGEASCFSIPAELHHAVIPVLSHAAHNIIANSPESWWCAWLNSNPDKIVIAPQQWSYSDNFPDLIPQFWISIPIT